MGHLLEVAALLSFITIAYKIATTKSASCSTGATLYGPDIDSYTVTDYSNHGANPHAVILLDSIVPYCCGVITGFRFMVLGDTPNYGCENGCYIDLIIWKDYDSVAQLDGYGATIHGIVHDVVVYTDLNWPGSPTAYVAQLPDADKIPIDGITDYYVGWNCYDVFAVDYVEDTQCSGVVCSNNILTTEGAFTPAQGYWTDDLVNGTQYRNFYYVSAQRFYALQVIAESGVAPSFLRQQMTVYVKDSLSAGEYVAFAEATNPETKETLVYSKVTETPNTPVCFNVNADGSIVSALAMTSCPGSHDVTVTVTDGCQSAATPMTFTFIVYPSITGGATCPTNNSIFGSSIVPQYTVHDNSNHINSPQATILLDPIDVPNCCGVVTGFVFMVNGDTNNYGCEQAHLGCYIDLIVWRDLDMTILADGFGATIHGIVRDVYVETDPYWPSKPQLTTIALNDSQKIPVDTSKSYYIGWNCFEAMAVDFLGGSDCSQDYVSCLATNKILTTETYSPKGFDTSVMVLKTGTTYRNFTYSPEPRFYAFQAMVAAGVSPSFTTGGTTSFLSSSTAAGEVVATPVATNPETREELTFSKTSETPTGITCFDVDLVNGEVTTAQAMSACVGTHSVTVTVSDGCNSASTTYTFVVWEPTTSAATTSQGSTGSAESTVTVSVGTGTSTTTSSTTTATSKTTTAFDLINTTNGKAMVGVCAGLGLLAAGTVFALCILLNKKQAESVNQITSPEQITTQLNSPKEPINVRSSPIQTSPTNAPKDPVEVKAPPEQTPQADAPKDSSGIKSPTQQTPRSNTPKDSPEAKSPASQQADKTDAPKESVEFKSKPRYLDEKENNWGWM